MLQVQRYRYRYQVSVLYGTIQVYRTIPVITGNRMRSGSGHNFYFNDALKQCCGSETIFLDPDPL
jgi:hypothetical protein